MTTRARALTAFARLGLLGLLCLSAAGLSAACGGGDSGGSSEPECAAPAFTNLGGNWFVQETMSSTDCPIAQPEYSILITQADSQLTIVGRTSFRAEICGSRAEATSDPTVVTENGVRTYRNLIMSFSSDTQFSGTAQWTLQSDATTCSGTSSFTGIR